MIKLDRVDHLILVGSGLALFHNSMAGIVEKGGIESWWRDWASKERN